MFILIGYFTPARAQYLCDFEYKTFNKQKRKIKKKCNKISIDWINQNRDSLNLPNKLKLSKLKFRSNEKETDKNYRYNKWAEIDSLLCVQRRPDPDYIKKAKKRLLELQLVVFDIRTQFDYSPSPNNKIHSVLNFEFNFQGNLIRAVIRKKKMSPN